jgi:hypothetical protein
MRTLHFEQSALLSSKNGEINTISQCYSQTSASADHLSVSDLRRIHQRQQHITYLVIQTFDGSISINQTVFIACLAQERQSELLADNAPSAVGTNEVLGTNSFLFEGIPAVWTFLQMNHNILFGLFKVKQFGAEFYGNPEAAFKVRAQNTLQSILIQVQRR